MRNLKMYLVIICFINVFFNLSLLPDVNHDLLDAAFKGDIEKAKIAIRNGADVNTKCDETLVSVRKKDLFYYKGSSPLHISSGEGHFRIVELLINSHAEIEVKNFYEERTPLHYAIISGNKDTINSLLNKNANLEANDFYNQTPIFTTVLYKQYDILKLLLMKGANAKHKDYNNQSIIYLIPDEDFFIVKYLSENTQILENREELFNVIKYFLKYSKLQNYYTLFKKIQFSNQDDVFDWIEYLSFAKFLKKEDYSIFLKRNFELFTSNDNFQINKILIVIMGNEINKHENIRKYISDINLELLRNIKSFRLNKIHPDIIFEIGNIFFEKEEIENAGILFESAILEKGYILKEIMQNEKYLKVRNYLLKNKNGVLSKIIDSKRPKFVVQNGHYNDIIGLIASRKSNLIISNSIDGTVKIWNNKGLLLHNLPGEAGMKVAISPNNNNFATGKNKIIIWDFSGNQLVELEKPDNSIVNCLTYSSKGDIIAGGFHDGTIRFWNVNGGLIDKIKISNNSVENIIYDYQENIITHIANNNTYYIYNSIYKTISHFPNTKSILSLKLSPDKDLMAIVYDDKVEIKNYKNEIICEISISLKVKDLEFLNQEEIMIIYENGIVKKYNINNSIGKLLFDIGKSSALTISPEWKRIIISDNKKISIINFEGRLIQSFPESKESIKEIIFSPLEDYFLVIHKENDYPYLWNMQGTYISKIEMKVDKMIFSPDGKNIAISRGGNLKIIDFSGRIIKNYLFKNVFSITHILYSRDGKKVSISDYAGNTILVDIFCDEVTRVDRKSTGRNLKPELLFSEDSEFFITFSENETLKIWKINGELLEDINQIVLDAKFISSSSIIYFKNEECNIISFKGNSFSHSKENFKQIERVMFSKNNNFFITEVGSNAIKAYKVVNEEIKLLSTVDSFKISRYYKYDLIGEGQILMIGENQEILIMNLDGSPKYRLEGHVSKINKTLYLKSSEILVSYSEDNEIRFWNLQKGLLINSLVINSSDKYLEKIEALSVNIPYKQGEWFMYTPDNYFDASANGAQYMNIRKENEVFRVDQFAVKFNRPDILLKRMGSQDIELIEFYRKKYKSRIKKYIGKPLSYDLTDDELIEIEKTKLSDDFHVPNIDNLNLTRGRMERGTFISKDKDDRNAKFAKLTFKISDTKEILKSYNIFINDVPLYPEGKNVTKQEEKTINVEDIVELTSGENKIEVSCMNQKGTESFRDITFADYDGKEKGNLYFIGFGVSKYKDERLNLKFANNDIKSQADIFKQMEEKAYDKVFIYNFIDNQVTTESIKKAKNLLEDVTVDDTVILSISGHGAHEKKEKDPNETYYFITHETNIDKLKETAANFELIEDLLEGTKENPLKARKKLFFMDTCESGEIDDDTRQSLEAALSNNETAKKKGIHLRSVNIKNGTNTTSSSQNCKESDQKQKVRPYVYEKDRFIHNDLFRRTGAIVFSSSRGGEFSQEQDDIESGVFSYSIINALKYDAEVADKNKDGFISIEELKEYVMKSVPEQTSNTQHPTVDRDNLSLKILFPVIHGK